MELNSALLAAIRALSFVDINVKKNYALVRTAQRTLHPFLAPPHKFRDITIPRGRGKKGISARLFIPEEQRSDDLILYFHGGGWATGDVDSFSPACLAYAEQTGRHVLSVEYRLAPENPFPTALLDCACALGQVARRKRGIGAKYGRVIISGDSAGANLCAALSLYCRDRKDYAPDAQILFYPAVNNDYSESSRFRSVHDFGKDFFLTDKRITEYMELYASSPEDYSDPYFAPLLSENLSDQPDTLILTAEYDPLRDEGEEYAVRLGEAGNRVRSVRISSTLHGFIQLSPKERCVRQGFEIAEDFLSHI